MASPDWGHSVEQELCTQICFRYSDILVGTTNPTTPGSKTHLQMVDSGAGEGRGSRLLMRNGLIKYSEELCSQPEQPGQLLTSDGRRTRCDQSLQE